MITQEELNQLGDLIPQLRFHNAKNRKHPREWSLYEILQAILLEDGQSRLVTLKAEADYARKV